jgi:hypothetical protein
MSDQYLSSDLFNRIEIDRIEIDTTQLDALINGLDGRLTRLQIGGDLVAARSDDVTVCYCSGTGCKTICACPAHDDFW